jgi:hypothetical protein
MTVLVSLRAVSDPSRWPLPHERPAISQGEAMKSRQSIEAGIVHNKKSSKIQKKALQYIIL